MRCYAKRISYVIGEDRHILRAYPKVDPNTHLDQVLGDLAANCGGPALVARGDDIRLRNLRRAL